MATIVVFGGEYDMSSQKALRAELKRRYDEPVIVLDFTDVTYIDSSCITELIKMSQHRSSNDMEPPNLIVASTPVRRIVEITGLSRLFKVVSSMDDLASTYKEPFVMEYAFRTDPGAI